MFITQISSKIDEMLDCCSLEGTNLYHKNKNMLYISICKDGDENHCFYFEKDFIKYILNNRTSKV